MQISEIMSRDVVIVSPSDSLQKVVQKMAEIDSGIMPVGENDRLVDIITDRDIVLRAVAKGKPPGKSTVQELMSPDVKSLGDLAMEPEAEEQSKDALVGIPQPV